MHDAFMRLEIINHLAALEVSAI